MILKILSYVGILLAVVVVVEIAALLAMKHSVGRYAQYWQDRAAQPASDDALVYVAFGDSTAQGIGATSAAKSYVGLIAEQLESTSGRPVRVINLSSTGARVADVLDTQFPALERLGLKLDQADLITMEIGANDLLTYDEATFQAGYDTILSRLPADKTVISDMPYFGGRVDAKGNDRFASAVIADVARSYDIAVAPLYENLSNRHSLLIYSADYFHPSNHGYRIWYDTFWSVIETKLPR